MYESGPGVGVKANEPIPRCRVWNVATTAPRWFSTLPVAATPRPALSVTLKPTRLRRPRTRLPPSGKNCTSAVTESLAAVPEAMNVLITVTVVWKYVSGLKLRIQLV